ncbi:MAG: ABC transporter ATP-binding protein [Bacteroidota bacterium]|nr:ABC transporter ATP-binding protein [Bacteroidota bacterium]
MTESKQNIIIEAKDLEFSYLIQPQGINSIKEYLLSFGRHKMFEKKQVLKGVNIEIQKGECVGLMGRNGSGKSTLLRVLAGIIKAEKGSVKVKGRIAPMLALGVGLEAEMTGAENIWLGGTILGLSRKEIQSSINKIIDFSELSKKDISMQVKRYSTGMMARLAFSIAVATDPEILFIDEVLTVGDIGFQNKCYARINEIRNSGSTIIFVSHFHSEIAKVCTRAVCIENGKIVFDGTVQEVGEFYNAQFN